VGGKSLVSCERKRSYHLFHADAAILFLKWKKKKKQSISLSLSWWNRKKAIMTTSLLIHMEAIHLSLSHPGKQILCLIMWQADEDEEEAIHLSLIVESNPLSDVEAEQKEKQSPLSLSLSHTHTHTHMWKRSSFSCGSRSSNHLSRSLALLCVEAILFLKQSYPLCIP
jgi:hypothetical protein